ncbi:MAG: cupredoxin domain-containing protein [Candidatus Caldarchaeum sp.]
MVKLRPSELIAIVLLGLTVLVTLFGPFYFDNVTRAEKEKEHVFYVTARQWVFEPAEFVVKKGEKVTFIVSSADVVHGFMVTGYNIVAVINPGEFVKITFTADRAGVFEIRCSVYCGEPLLNSGAGHWLMKGVLKVVEL